MKNTKWLKLDVFCNLENNDGVYNECEMMAEVVMVGDESGMVVVKCWCMIDEVYE